MSQLGRDELERVLEESDLGQRLVVTPLLDRRQVGRGSIDLRLGTEFLLLRRTSRAGLRPGYDPQPVIDAMQERVIVPVGDDLWLHPRHFMLAATLEYLGLPDYLSASVVGRSSWGRLGLIVATAVFVHPGFRGCLTLELINEGDSPIRLSPGIPIAQLVVQRLGESVLARGQEQEKYEAPVRPQPSRLASERRDFDALENLGQRLRSRLG